MQPLNLKRGINQVVCLHDFEDQLKRWEAYLVTGYDDAYLRVRFPDTISVPRRHFYLWQLDPGDVVMCIQTAPSKLVKEGTKYRVIHSDYAQGDGLVGLETMAGSVVSSAFAFWAWRFVDADLYDRLTSQVGTPEVGEPRCTECNGSGVYVGLFVRETCRTCGGKKG